MVRQKWTDEKVSEIREAKADGLMLREIQKKFSLSKGQVNFAVYKYKMKQTKEEKVKLEKNKNRDLIAGVYDAKEKNKKEAKRKTFLEWLFG